MTGIIRKYGIYILIFGAILTAALIWFVLIKENTPKIPARGVFVTLARDLGSIFNRR